MLRFQAKRPARHAAHPVSMGFDYDETYGEGPPDAYETLLLDAVRGDATLFMRSDQVEAAWEVVKPVLDAWDATPPAELPNYAAGRGPAASTASSPPTAARGPSRSRPTRPTAPREAAEATQAAIVADALPTSAES